MENDIQVFASFRSGFGMEIDTIILTDSNDNKIELNKKQWEEIQFTLKGKRKTASTEIKEGSFQPETIVVWN